MNCDVGKVTEGLDNELGSFSKLFVTSPKSQFILQPRFSYVTSSSLKSLGEPPMTRSEQQPMRQRCYLLPCLHFFLRMVSLLFLLSGALSNNSYVYVYLRFYIIIIIIIIFKVLEHVNISGHWHP